MYKICFLLAITLSCISAWGQSPVSEACESILARLETNELTDVSLYDECGFNNESLVWGKWSGYVSENKMKKALYEICRRFPVHEYHELYCEKSAQLGYGPALAVLGEIAFSQDNAEKGISYFIQALETKELSEEQEGKIVEILGAYYLKKHDPKAVSYLKSAALKRSAVANNIMGYLTYSAPDQNEESDKLSFEYFWRGILLGCPSAEENLGLFQLVRLKKITKEMALKQMKKNLYSCTPVLETAETKSASEEMLSCRCKSVLENEKRFSSKPYFLIQTNGKTALLRLKDGKELSVSEKDNLPDGGRVAQVRKTAVILTYPHDRREILNMYKPDKCVEFCQEHQINENLSVEEMQKRISGAAGIQIKPYRLSFTEQECEVIRYYAPSLVDINQSYVGKTECMNNKGNTKDPILDRLSPLEKEPIKKEEQVLTEENDDFSIREKQKLHLLGEELIEK